MPINIPDMEGWHLLGAFPDNDPNDVGSWLLHHERDALLLAVPPGLTAGVVEAGLKSLGVTLRYVTASHTHEDHLDAEAWNALGPV
jgi:glyoxylase-like metal-dependent hydrolase (beta-lactamase superfamily II)